MPIFLAFLGFGARGFGGPVVQIQALLDEFVVRRGWTGEARFRRALGVYQVLPGPEAHEMCCYLGTVRGGRLGGIAAGLGFMLPGLVLMLGASALYGSIDLAARPAAFALAAMQLAACALILRAAWKLAQPVRADWRLCAMVLGAAATIAVLATQDAASPGTAATNDTVPRGALELFSHGLVAGLVTFGGAYTALPFVTSVAAGEGGWMTQEACLDGVAIASVLPAPLVIFGTFVGFRGGGLLGALAFTAGMFLPAFGFTFVGFEVFERLVAWRPARAALDLAGAVAVGLIAGSALAFAGESLGVGRAGDAAFGVWPSAALLAVSFGFLVRRKGPFVAPTLVIASGVLGALAGVVADLRA